MTSYPERLWPSEDEQPTLEITLGDESYVLQWKNTWIQTYRTGIPEYDEQLESYSHVLHRYAGDDEHGDFLIISFEQIGEENLNFLREHGYREHQDPIPDHYILAYMANIQASELPESIGPDFNAEAA